MMLRQGFLCWMSKPGGTCRDIKSLVMTRETNRRQNLCRDIDYWNLENLLRYCKKKYCRDKVMNVITLKDKVSSSDRETKSRQVMLT